MADRVDLVVDQGTTFEVDFLVKNSANNTLDVSTYTGTGKARKFISSNNAIVMQVNCFSNGIVRATLSANQTANMVYTDRYQYDVKLTSASNTVIRIVEGSITIMPQVSY